MSGFSDEKRRVLQWKETGKLLEALRLKELRSLDSRRALLNLSSAYQHCGTHAILRPSSGLVEQQLWFRKLRNAT